MKRSAALAVVTACLGWAASTSMAGIINVPANQPTIQAGIDAAVDGDEVVVAPGVYNEVIDFSDGELFPQDKAITVRSSAGPGATIIDGTGINSSVVTCENGATATTKLQGFTIRHGTGTVLGVALRGGGMLNFMSSPTVRDCIFTLNTANGGDGGAVYNFFSSARFINCMFYGNSAPEGGAVYNDSNATPRFDNCVLTNNSATTGGGVYTFSGAPLFLNSIIWNNTATSFGPSFAGGGAPIVRYSCIQGGFAGEGNIAVNPLFVNAASDFHLQGGSPCIDAGDSTVISNSVFEDIAGDQRGADVPTVADTGVPVFGLVVDMGPYEVPGGSCGPSECLGDVTGPVPGVPDGVVDALDLLALIGSWGNCSSN